MNYGELDNRIMFRQRRDKYDACHELGFEYISEAVIFLYKTLHSSVIADLFDVKQGRVISWLKRWGVPRRKPGGNLSSQAYRDRYGYLCSACGAMTEPYRRKNGKCCKCWGCNDARK